MTPRALSIPLACALVGCAAPADLPSTASPPPATPAVASASTSPDPSSPSPARPPAKGPTRTTAAAPKEVRTKNAMFRAASFEELPGWQQDDIRAGWSAFRNSCGPLQKRPEWRDLCSEAASVPPTEKAMRAFFESRFTVLRILDTQAGREGEVTGYFEPLLEGQPQRGGAYIHPVLGVPRGLYTLDWARVPAAQRQGVVRVRPQGDRLALAPAGGPGTYAMDLRRFVLDDRDRKLRARLVDGPSPRVEPYYSRGELEALGLTAGVDAPVLAWVDDPLALYAMQVQGSGRILMPDTSVLRVQYAEQNGHPFRPLRVVAKAQPVTRGAAPAAAVDEFVIEGEDDAPADAVVTRGGRPTPSQASGSGDPLVEELLKSGRKAPAAGTPAPTSAATPKPPATATTAPTPPARATSPAPVEPRRNSALTARIGTDPSYVFFKVAPERRPASEGPQGALGVPLTAGRSVAVDPRVTPLGYPVYLSAPAPAGSRVQVQRLVFAQDTGGAIRGALRADYFWGFGAEAGQLARSTRHRGQMWVLVPNGEAARLASSRLVTRGAGTPDRAELDGQCLIDDGEFCSEIPD